MKFNNIIKSMFGFAALASVVLTATSCEDEPDKYEIAGGSPEVIYIRPALASASDSLLTQAYMGDLVVLVGNNLRSVTELYFNDKKATLNTSYITDHTLFVTVPTALTDNPTDMIYMVNNGGDTTAFPFYVAVPAPVLNSMKCEYVKPGEVATINGDYLLNYESSPMVITMPDGKQVTEFKKCEKNQVSFVVPEGCTQSGAITVTTKYGKTVSKRFQLNDERGMMFEFDGVTNLSNHGWHAREIKSEGGITGNYVQLGDGATAMSEDGAWNDSQFSFEYWCGDWNNPQTFEGDGAKLDDLVDFSDFSNMAVKFEMFVPSSNSWSAGAMQLIFAGVDRVTMSGNPLADGTIVPGANNTYFNSGDGYPRALYRPWGDVTAFNTGDEWITVTVPINEFKYYADGTAATLSLNEKSFSSLMVFVWSGGVNGTECTPIIKLDNIRAVPYK